MKSLKYTVALLSIVVLVPCTAAFAAESITVTSFGGAFSQSQIEAYQKPFSAKTGVTVNAEVYNGGLAEVRAQVQAGNVTWDVVDLGSHYPDDLGRLGFLEPIDYSVVDKTDLLPKFAGKYHVGTITYSDILAYRTDVFPEGQAPTSTADFWDVKKFPGRRSLYNLPPSNYAFAMVALGYKYDEIYPLTEDKIAKIYQKMDEIKPHVTVWWKAGAQPAQLLVDIAPLEDYFHLAEIERYLSDEMVVTEDEAAAEEAAG